MKRELTWNVFFGEFDVDDVAARFSRSIHNTTGVIVIVLTVHVGFTWSLD